MVSLFSPTSFGALKLQNRIVMAPMTRSRSTEDGAAVGLALVMTLGLVWLVAVVGETST